MIYMYNKLLEVLRTAFIQEILQYHAFSVGRQILNTYMTIIELLYWGI